jgi:hypothetical protein
MLHTLSFLHGFASLRPWHFAMPVGDLLPIRIWDGEKVTAFSGKKDVTGCKIANPPDS